MTTETAMVLTTTITATVALVAAVLAHRSARAARSVSRQGELEERLARSDRDNHLLFLWNRQLVDHVYRGLPPPPPPPPDGLFT